MKFFGRFTFTLMVASIILQAEEPAKPAEKQELTKMIVDLRSNPPGIFQYSTWEGKVTSTQSGLAIVGAKGAMGRGGFGRDISPALDLSAAVYVEVALGTIPGNEVPEITIALNDADGTQFTARVRVDQLVPGQPVWMRARREDFRLNSGEAGADGKMDWSTISRWHLQGDWKTEKPCSVIFVAMRFRHL